VSAAQYLLVRPVRSKPRGYISISPGMGPSILGQSGPLAKLAHEKPPPTGPGYPLSPFVFLGVLAGGP
jgi:hypothetical protein